MNVRVLTEGQKTSIDKLEFVTDMCFNPVQDIDGNWVISEEEIEQCDKPQFNWVKTLPQIEFKPVPEPEDSII